MRQPVERGLDVARLLERRLSVQAGFRRFIRQLPENGLPPLLVMALITPPVNRPYSAEMPDVSTCVSWIASSMNRFCGVAKRLSLTSTPLIMNTLSNANAPLMTTWFELGARSVSAGAIVAMPWMRRATSPAGRSRPSVTLSRQPVSRSAPGLGHDLDGLGRPRPSHRDVLINGQPERDGRSLRDRGESSQPRKADLIQTGGQSGNGERAVRIRSRARGSLAARARSW